MYNFANYFPIRIWEYLLARFSGDRILTTKLNQQLEFRGRRSHFISLYL
ncbi:hypothetical protein H6G36_00815 [Anabaena minutissima FACHB-250]|nr:hypothetical protein [Anabaena minutissima FACHB-250]